MRTVRTWMERPTPKEMVDVFYGLPWQDRSRAVWLLSRAHYCQLQGETGFSKRLPLPTASILGKPVRFVEQGAVDLCVRDMPVRLRFTPKKRAA